MISNSDSESCEMIPGWVPKQMLNAIIADAIGCDPARTEMFAEADAERVHRAIVNVDRLLATRPCLNDDDVVDARLARSALLVVGAIVRSLTGESDG